MELGVLIMIASAFGISEALVQSGASHLVAQAMMSIASPFGSVSLLSSLLSRVWVGDAGHVSRALCPAFPRQLYFLDPFIFVVSVRKQ